MARRTHRAALTLLTLTWASSVLAKDIGIQTPTGKQIYDSNETFSDVDDTRKRRFVVEAVAGLGPEGNIGMLIGWINQPVRGFEYYAGFGYEANPALNVTGSVRYVFNIDGWRPYLAVGYIYKNLERLGTYNHNVFGEIGYSWVLHDTYHLTAGVGVRRILGVGIREDSPLKEPDVDPVLLASETDDMARWAPMVALRFSRAF